VFFSDKFSAVSLVPEKNVLKGEPKKMLISMMIHWPNAKQLATMLF